MDSKEQRKRMAEGKLYLPTDEDIMKEQMVYLNTVYDFNATRPFEKEKRSKLIKEMFAKVGQNCYIEPPIHANFGCKHVHFGDDVYANFNLTLVDDGNIYVGNNVMFAPNVIVTTAGHPVEPELRRAGCQHNQDVRIGNNVWIGAGVIILPGITIGDNSVIGAGSIVTKDIPNDVVAVGNPCKVLRKINDHDKKYYFKDKKIDITVDEL